MKRLTTNMMIAAAALAAAAGSASAQTLKADIPFTFHAGPTVMAPGAYQMKMHRSSSAGWFVLSNEDTGRSVILAQYTAHDASRNWQSSGLPKLGFECAGASCVLREVFPATDRNSYRLRGPKLSGDEPVRVAEIRMVKAD